MAKKQNTKIRIYYDTTGNTLNVWFDDPKKDYVSEEAGDDVILNKDRRGRVIGFEKLNFSARDQRPLSLPVESQVF